MILSRDRDPNDQELLAATAALCDLVGPEFLPTLMIKLAWPRPVQEEHALHDIRKLIRAIDSLVAGGDCASSKQTPSPLFLVVWDGRRKWKRCKVFAQFDEAQLAQAPVMTKVPMLWAELAGEFDVLNLSLAIGLQAATFELVKHCKQSGDPKPEWGKTLGFWSPSFDSESEAFKLFGGKGDFIR